MFVEVVQQERLSVSPKEVNLQNAVLETLRKHVPGHQVGCGGVSLFPLGIDAIDDIEIHDGMLYPLVTYRVVMYRAYVGEILMCEVEKQDTAGIFLVHALLPGIHIPSGQIPQPSELCTLPVRTSRVDLWCWKYNDVRLYVKAGEVCKVRVIKIGKEGTIYATIAGPGLGPLSWW
ncbi:DNA-directed RNA polymerase III subunit RPC8 [Nematocida displodere]|uniref:DNA-directed RNA polymerase III subunit RPC8 n=1 Tax=Nematocida displodere TaxID=1805483 RepID=A0A177EL10_9MICR|nr:DNA-directed RNA polymerase III subunit RPC8 [Nematocida displodere]